MIQPGQFHKLVEGLSDAKSSADMAPWPFLGIRSDAVRSRCEVTVLYGSETGNSEEQAKNLMQDFLIFSHFFCEDKFKFKFQMINNCVISL